tara:strand:- start:237 stop:647 length:411 start_codon:yes stop_codon:yes gene_type:complete
MYIIGVKNNKEVFEYSLDIVLGNTSANIKINIEIVGMINDSEIIFSSKKRIVKNDEARTFEKLIPININIKVSSFLSINFEVYSATNLFCFFHTFICIGFDFINDISAAENNTDKKIPINEYNNRNSDIDLLKIKQ